MSETNPSFKCREDVARAKYEEFVKHKKNMDFNQLIPKLARLRNNTKAPPLTQAEIVLLCWAYEVASNLTYSGDDAKPSIQPPPVNYTIPTYSLQGGSNRLGAIAKLNWSWIGL